MNAAALRERYLRLREEAGTDVTVVVATKYVPLDEPPRLCEAVGCEEAARGGLVDVPIETEVVACDEPDDLVPERVRIPQPPEDPCCRDSADGRMRLVGPVRPRLRDVVEEPGEADLQLDADVGRRLGDREEVLVQRVRLPR